MKKLLPLILILLGLGAGAGAGLALRPAPPADDDVAAAPVALPSKPSDFVRLNNQFIVPVVEQGRVASLIVLALSLEVDEGTNQQVFAREPKLRDAFLQVLFDHANSGGFRGNFTESTALVALRRALRETARQVVGGNVQDVLITDFARQDN
jgi:flagellar protein FliL